MVTDVVPRSDLAIGLTAIALGAILLFAFEPGAGIPEPSRLEKVTGQVAWVEDHRYGVRFGLSNDPRAFDYSSKGNALGRVEGSLRTAGTSDVTILIDPIDPTRPIYSDEEYFGVWDIRAGGKSVRTFEEIAAAWRQDDGLGKWLGAAFILAGLWLVAIALRKHFGRDTGVGA